MRFIALSAIIACGMATQAIAHARGPNAADVLGRTPEEIHQRFAGIIEQNFASGNAETLVNNLKERELEGLAMTYRRTASGPSGRLLTIFSRRLSPTSLMRISRHFGLAQMSQAVEENAPRDVAKQFALLAKAAPHSADFMRTPYMRLAGPAPTIDMTPEEIYLEFRTAPVGSLSPAAALVETGKFISWDVAWAFGAGWEFGSAVKSLIDKYDPDLNDVIGGTIDQALQNIHDASDDMIRGEMSKAWDDLFSGPVQSSGDVFGDWNTMWELGDFIEQAPSGGQCVSNPGLCGLV